MKREASVDSVQPEPEPQPEQQPLALQRWRHARLGCLGLTGILLALGAAAQNTNTVYAYSGNNGPVFDITQVGLPVQAGTPGPINLGTWGAEPRPTSAPPRAIA